MIRFIEKMLDLGVAGERSNSRSLYVILSNKIALLAMLVTIPFFFIFYFMKLGLLFLALGLLELMFMSTFLFNKFGFVNFARINLLFWGNVGCVIFTIIAGRETGFYYPIYGMAMLSIVIFRIKQKEMMATCIGFSVVSIIVLELFFHVPAMVEISDVNAHILRFLLHIVTFILLIVSLYLYYQFHKVTLQEVTAAYDSAKKSMVYAEKVSQEASYVNLSRRIAHEIRTPITVIQGGIENLLESVSENSDEKLYKSMVKRNIDRIVRLTDILLRYGDTVSEKVNRFDLSKVINDSVYVVQKREEKKRVTYLKKYPENIVIQGKRNQLYQVFSSLMNNSFEAISDEGFIEIDINKTEFEDLEAKLVEGIVVKVKDNGKGIDKEKLKDIFDPFYTTESTKVGLELSVATRSVNDHQGKIEVVSEVGRGTCFKVFLPNEQS
jgi:signal transduction histidine kinase